MREKEKTNLSQAFEFVRETFFPRWDGKHEWKVKIVWHLPTRGKYDDTSKKILLRFIPKDKAELYSLLIHEICHYISPYHGKRFRDRLIKAKVKAEEIGLKGVAEKIEKELSLGKEPYDDTYQQIQDIVTMDCPKVSWMQLLRYISRQRGRYPEEFLRRYPRAKKIYLKAKKEAKENEKIEEKFRQSMKGGEST